MKPEELGNAVALFFGIPFGVVVALLLLAARFCVSKTHNGSFKEAVKGFFTE